MCTVEAIEELVVAFTEAGGDSNSCCFGLSDIVKELIYLKIAMYCSAKILKSREQNITKIKSSLTDIFINIRARQGGPRSAPVSAHSV
jgi:hypothetical protein